jgi:hypothetical protein
MKLVMMLLLCGAAVSLGCSKNAPDTATAADKAGPDETGDDAVADARPASAPHRESIADLEVPLRTDLPSNEAASESSEGEMDFSGEESEGEAF